MKVKVVDSPPEITPEFTPRESITKLCDPVPVLFKVTVTCCPTLAFKDEEE